MQVLEETSRLLVIVEEEANTSIGESPFQVFVVVWRDIQSERSGT